MPASRNRSGSKRIGINGASPSLFQMEALSGIVFIPNREMAAMIIAAPGISLI